MSKLRRTFLVAVLAVISLLQISSVLIQQTTVSAYDIIPLAKPSPKPTPTPSPTHTPTPTHSPTPSRTPTPSPTPSLSPIPTPTPSPSSAPTPLPTPTPTPTPTATPTPTPTQTPTPLSTPTPTQDPSPMPTPTLAPYQSPTPTPKQTITSNPTFTPTPTQTPTPSPTPFFASKSLQATSINGTTVNLGVNGITALSVIAPVISIDQYVTQTTLSLAVIGQKNTNNLNTITIPTTAVSYGVTPEVYVNNQVALDQGFSQDANKYSIWYKTVFSTYELTIVFTTKNSPTGFPTAAILSIVVIVPLSFATVLLDKRKAEQKKRKRRRKKYWESKPILSFLYDYIKSLDS